MVQVIFNSLAVAQLLAPITYCANAYSFDMLYANNVEALANEVEVSRISTLGNSENILRALTAAKLKNVYVLAFLGSDGGKCLGAFDLTCVVRFSDTESVQ